MLIKYNLLTTQIYWKYSYRETHAAESSIKSNVRKLTDGITLRPNRTSELPYSVLSQSVFTCSKSALEIIKQCLKFVQS